MLQFLKRILLRAAFPANLADGCGLHLAAEFGGGGDEPGAIAQGADAGGGVGEAPSAYTLHRAEEPLLPKGQRQMLAVIFQSAEHLLHGLLRNRHGEQAEVGEFRLLAHVAGHEDASGLGIVAQVLHAPGGVACVNEIFGGVLGRLGIGLLTALPGL